MQSEHVKFCSSVQHIYKTPTNFAQLQAYTVNDDDDHNNNNLQNKFAPCGTDGRLFTTDISAKFKVT